MRKIIVAFAAVLIALSLTACSSGSSTTSSTTTDASTTAASPAVAAVAVPTADASAVESGFPEAFPSLAGTETPTAITQNLDDGQPMLVFFYDDAQEVSTVERVQVDAALKDNKGLIDLVTFDIGTKSAASPGAAAKTAAALAADLSITQTPYIIMIDANGFITWRFRGYVDSEIIQREILRATK